MLYTERSLATSSMTSQLNQIKLFFRCGAQHQPSLCRFKDYTCYYCRKKSHIIKVYRSHLRNERTKKPQHSQHHAHLLEADSTVASVMSKEVPTHEESNQAGDRTDDGSYPGTLYALEAMPDLKPLYWGSIVNASRHRCICHYHQ